MKKTMALILAVIMVLSVLVACSKPDPGVESPESSGKAPEESKGPSAESTPAAESEPDESLSEYGAIGIPEGLNYKDEQVTIVHWERWDDVPTEFEIAADDLAGDPVDDAIYKRNLYTEQLLGVDLNFVHLYLELGNINEMLDWCNRLENMMGDPSTPVDIVASYRRCIATATVRGIPQNLSVYSSLDFEKDWWPEYIKDEFDIGGQMFFATGDISTYLLYSMYMIFFNENMVEQYGMDNPYTLVEDREWTVDKMIEMTSSVYEDIDGVAGKTPGDLFSFTLEWWGSDAFIQGAGFKILENEKDGDDYIKITEDFKREIRRIS